MDRYEMTIFWSSEDTTYVVDIPDLPGCMSHGATRLDALRNAEEATELWLDTAREFGDPIPEPRERDGSVV